MLNRRTRTWTVLLLIAASFGCDGLIGVEDEVEGGPDPGDDAPAVTVERLPDPPGYESGGSIRALTSTTAGFYVVVDDGDDETPDRIAGWKFEDPRWHDFGAYGSVVDITSDYEFDDGFNFWFARYSDETSLHDSNFDIQHSTGPDATQDLRVANIDRIALSGGPDGRLYLDGSFDHIVAETYTLPGAWETIGAEEGTLDEGFLPSDAGDQICEMQGAADRDALWITAGTRLYLLEARSKATVWDISSTGPGCVGAIADDGDHMVLGSGASVISYAWPDDGPVVLVDDVGEDTPVAGSGFSTEAVDLKESRVYATQGKVFDVQGGELVGGYLPRPDASDQETMTLVSEAAQPESILADPRHNAVYMLTGDGFIRASWSGVLPEWECPYVGC